MNHINLDRVLNSGLYEYIPFESTSPIHYMSSLCFSHYVMLKHICYYRPRYVGVDDEVIKHKILLFVNNAFIKLIEEGRSYEYLMYYTDYMFFKRVSVRELITNDYEWYLINHNKKEFERIDGKEVYKKFLTMYTFHHCTRGYWY